MRAEDTRFRYKIDIMDALKDKGFTTSTIREHKIFGESALQKIRTGGMVSWTVLEKICIILGKQPGDLIELDLGACAGEKDILYALRTEKNAMRANLLIEMEEYIYDREDRIKAVNEYFQRMRTDAQYRKECEGNAEADEAEKFREEVIARLLKYKRQIDDLEE